jgi:hypothetical protein
MALHGLRSGDDSRSLAWAHGRAELQRLGGMLGPVAFKAPGRADFQPLQVAPWAGEPGAGELPGILRRLRGEWPCVPFGRVDTPRDWPPGWTPTTPDDEWSHGYAAHHEWAWIAQDDPLVLALRVSCPDESPVRCLTRHVAAVADAPALEITLRIDVRRPCILPIALHPTLRLDPGRVELRVPHRGQGFTYPVDVAPDRSRLAPDRRFAALSRVPAIDGDDIDLSRYPQAVDSEELVQLMDADGPVTVRYVDQRWSLEIDWDRAQLPDVLLWVSHRGRAHAPWNGRHLALGVEPLNGVFDLGRVASPPADHPLAQRRGIALEPGKACVVRYSLRATAG